MWLLSTRLCSSCTRAFHTKLTRAFSSASDSSAELIAKWQTLLQPVSGGTDSNQPQLTGQLMKQLCQDAIQVYSTEGAASVVPDRVTDIFMAAYQQVQDPQGKLQFFKLLVTEFGVQRQAVDEAVHLWLNRAPASSHSSDPQQHEHTSSVSSTNHNSSSGRDGSSGSGDPAATAIMSRLAERLSAAAQPLYLQLLLPVSQHREGIRFLVDMRADLLDLMHCLPAAQLEQQGVALRALDQQLRSALARWFSLGLLQLQRITWEHSPGQLLQRVQQTEAVHKMQHLEELQRRLQQSDRRVFAFMHPSLPGEPLVVLHTAILDHVPSSMQAVLAQQQQQQQRAGAPGSAVATTTSSNSDGSDGGSCVAASVACFYSISSSQKGLAGVDLGNFLIKKAAQLLLAELPQLTTLVTLSPIPGFRSWLVTKLRQAAAAAGSDAGETAGPEQPTDPLLKPSEVAVLLSMQQQTGSAHQHAADSHMQEPHAQQAAAAGVLLQLVQDNGWVSLPPQQQEALRPVMLRLCAGYLLRERRRNLALCAVANFHLRNGAQVWRINWRADMSAQGLSNSCGLMVNYLYDLAQVVPNNQRYLLEHHVAASDAVQQLL